MVYPPEASLTYPFSGRAARLLHQFQPTPSINFAVWRAGQHARALSPLLFSRRQDLQAIDLALTQSLSSIRDIHLRGVVSDDDFRGMGLGGFEITTANGGKVELPTPGGASREVTLDNRMEFVDLAEAFKMREYRAPVRRRRRRTSKNARDIFVCRAFVCPLHVCVYVLFHIYFGDSPTGQGETCTALCSVLRGRVLHFAAYFSVLLNQPRSHRRR